jgi:hypothetical protein
MSPADDIPDLLCAAFASFAGAAAAVLLDRAAFATVFTILGAYAISIAITQIREDR